MILYNLLYIIKCQVVQTGELHFLSKLIFILDTNKNVETLKIMFGTITRKLIKTSSIFQLEEYFPG